jgi:hypothetical protein
MVEMAELPTPEEVRRNPAIVADRAEDLLGFDGRAARKGGDLAPGLHSAA